VKSASFSLDSDGDLSDRLCGIIRYERGRSDGDSPSVAHSPSCTSLAHLRNDSSRLITSPSVHSTIIVTHYHHGLPRLRKHDQARAQQTTPPSDQSRRALICQKQLLHSYFQRWCLEQAAGRLHSHRPLQGLVRASRSIEPSYCRVPQCKRREDQALEPAEGRGKQTSPNPVRERGKSTHIHDTWPN
jgi:hypothetical protein